MIESAYIINTGILSKNTPYVKKRIRKGGNSLARKEGDRPESYLRTAPILKKVC